MGQILQHDWQIKFILYEKQLDKIEWRPLSLQGVTMQLKASSSGCLLQAEKAAVIELLRQQGF